MTNIVWLQNHQEESLPHELRSHTAVFNDEDACFQFLYSLPSSLHGLTLVLTDPRFFSDRLVDLKSISTIYMLSSSKPDITKKHASKIRGIFADRASVMNQLREDLNQKQSPRPGFFTGILAPFQGLYFILSHSSTWLRALVPAIIFTVLLIMCSVPSIWAMNVATARLMQRQSSKWAHVGVWFLRLVLYIVAVSLSLIVALITAQPLSSPALESLVRSQERELNYPSRPEESFCSGVCRSIRVAIISLFISLSIFILLTLLELLFPPAVFFTTPLKFIATGFVLAYDIIDYPLSLHLLGVRERTPWFRHFLWATLGFGVAMEILFLIPGAFLLLLPAGVCGATRLVVAAERSSIDQPLLSHREGI
jgi:CysZ protein